MQDYEYETLVMRDDLLWIDVRSPGEWAESALPGAINIPLFDDDERALVGTVYKQDSPDAARELGLRIYGDKLPELVAAVRAATKGRTAAVYCWRGGMRSKAVATILELMGVPVVRLVGGYRAYRQYVTGQLAVLSPASLPPLIVIHGMTGVGKTMLLQQLAARGLPVLDLEAYAHHRGSVFGGIGLNPANQRQFDSALFAALRQWKDAPYLFMEAESKRIGRVSMPDGLFAAKLAGVNVELTADLPTRVERTLMQYQLADEDLFATEVGAAVARIERRFSPDLRKLCHLQLAARDYRALFAALLEEYYDPRYRHAMLQYEYGFLPVDGSDLNVAADTLQHLATSGELLTWLTHKEQASQGV